MSIGATELFGIRRGGSWMSVGATELFGVRRGGSWMSVGATVLFGIKRGDCRLPIGETALFGIRRRDCWLPIEVTGYEKARGVTVIDLIPYRDGSHDRGFHLPYLSRLDYVVKPSSLLP